MPPGLGVSPEEWAMLTTFFLHHMGNSDEPGSLSPPAPTRQGGGGTNAVQHTPVSAATEKSSSRSARPPVGSNLLFEFADDSAENPIDGQIPQGG